MRDVIVIGGGCYGTVYARQLAEAKDKGRAAYRRVIVVDRDARCRAKDELGEALGPAIGGRRAWEMGDAVRALAGRLRAAGEPVFGPALFVCRHHVFGVGTFSVDAILEGDEIAQAAGDSGEPAAVLVGTISSCHGALGMLRLGALSGLSCPSSVVATDHG